MPLIENTRLQPQFCLKLGFQRRCFAIQAILGYFKLHSGDTLYYLVSIVVVIVVMLIVQTVINRLFGRARQVMQQRGHDLSSLNFIRYTVLAVLYFFCIMAVADQIPALTTLGTLARSLLAGSGVLAVVIGIAGQEAAGNIVSGVLIIAFKPFKIGDVIRYLDKDVSGVVEEITLRHTVIRTFENKRLIVPNGIINSQVIENASFGDNKVCMFLDVGIGYHSDIEKAMKIMAQEVRNHPGYMDNRTPAEIASGSPEVLVRVTGLASSSVELRAFVWSVNSSIAYQMKSDLLRSILRVFDAEKIEIPYPHRTILLQSREAKEMNEHSGTLSLKKDQ